MGLNLSRCLPQIIHIQLYLPLQLFRGNFSWQEQIFLQTNVQKIVKSGSSTCSCMHVTPSVFFSRIKRSEALVNNSYFFQDSCFIEILFDIHCKILIQTLYFLMCFPTCQDGFQNCDHFYQKLKAYVRKLVLMSLP